MMTKWPVYRVTFPRDLVLEIAAPGIGSAMMDAVEIVNREIVKVAGPEHEDTYGISDILKIKQLGPVYVSPTLEAALPDLYLFEGRGPHGGDGS